VDDGVDVEQVAAQFLEKMKLIASIHESVLINVKQAQSKELHTPAEGASTCLKV